MVVVVALVVENQVQVLPDLAVVLAAAVEQVLALVEQEIHRLHLRLKETMAVMEVLVFLIMGVEAEAVLVLLEQ